MICPLYDDDHGRVVQHCLNGVQTLVIGTLSSDVLNLEKCVGLDLLRVKDFGAFKPVTIKIPEGSDLNIEIPDGQDRGQFVVAGEDEVLERDKGAITLVPRKSKMAVPMTMPSGLIPGIWQEATYGKGERENLFVSTMSALVLKKKTRKESGTPEIWRL